MRDRHSVPLPCQKISFCRQLSPDLLIIEREREASVGFGCDPCDVRLNLYCASGARTGRPFPLGDGVLGQSELLLRIKRRMGSC